MFSSQRYTYYIGCMGAIRAGSLAERIGSHCVGRWDAPSAALQDARDIAAVPVITTIIVKRGHRFSTGVMDMREFVDIIKWRREWICR